MIESKINKLLEVYLTLISKLIALPSSSLNKKTIEAEIDWIKKIIEKEISL